MRDDAHAPQHVDLVLEHGVRTGDKHHVFGHPQLAAQPLYQRRAERACDSQQRDLQQRVMPTAALGGKRANVVMTSKERH